jgi:hypothetical protein
MITKDKRMMKGSPFSLIILFAKLCSLGYAPDELAMISVGKIVYQV